MTLGIFLYYGCRSLTYNLIYAQLKIAYIIRLFDIYFNNSKLNCCNI